MRKIIMLLLLCAVPQLLSAQTHDNNTPQRAEMKKLNFLVGQWKGTGWFEMGPGRRSTFTQTEHVQNKLDGLALLIEGLGRGQLGGKGEEVVVHNALAVVSFDAQQKQHRFRAYRADGMYVDTTAQVSDRALVWSFQDPRAGHIKFTITLNDKGEWFEIGELSRDGKAWYKFFEMTLQRAATS